MTTLRITNAQGTTTSTDVKVYLSLLANCIPEDERAATLTALEPLQDVGDGLWLIPAKSKVESELFYQMLIYASAKGHRNITTPEPVDGFVVNIIRHRKDTQPTRSDRAAL